MFSTTTQNKQCGALLNLGKSRKEDLFKTDGHPSLPVMLYSIGQVYLLLTTNIYSCVHITYGRTLHRMSWRGDHSESSERGAEKFFRRVEFGRDTVNWAGPLEWGFRIGGE